MGDKNPKAISKQKSQKLGKTAKERRKRESMVAKQSPGRDDSKR
ncbi:MAG: hypothetical protein ACE148_16020 [Vicinamibacterales bacterium]